jgi:hypothetical protein
LSRQPRTNYDILKFKLSCFHECHEYKWGVCPHCRSRKICQDNVRPVYPSEEGIYYPTEMIEISPRHVYDLGTYIHEFTEASIIQVLRRFRINWHSFVEFKNEGLKSTYLTHVISPYGANNETCLEPSTHRHRPKW